jgi:hypothetical protein
MAKLITKSVRLNPAEDEVLKRLSQQEGVSEAALLKRFVRQGMAAQRLEQAIVAYQRGEADLSAAAQFAGVSVYHMMTELRQRDIAPPAEAEKFVDGLKTLVETFGGSDALQRTILSIGSGGKKSE